MQRAIIAGGGIVGLTTGRALREAGWDVTVAEQADAIRAAGASLGIWDNALKLFDELGVEVRSVGRDAEMYFRDTSGELLTTPQWSDEDHQYFLANRANLNDLLADAVGRDNIRLNSPVVGYEEHDDHVTVQFGDGSPHDADLLIGADGLHSVVRRQMQPGTEAREHVGHRGWRAVVRTDEVTVDNDRLIVGGKNRTRGGYARTHDGKAFWLLFQFDAPPPAASAKQECLERAEWLTDGSWDFRLPDLIEATPEELILHNQIMVVPPLDRWVSRRVALIGDAAHAMSPHITAGASLGVEDVGVLRERLAANDDLATALKEYEADRLPRYRRSAELSRAVEEAETAEDFAHHYAAYSHWMISQ